MIVICCILISLKIWDNLSLNKKSYQKKKCVSRMLVVMKATTALTYGIFGSVLIVKICVAHCSKVIL